MEPKLSIITICKDEPYIEDTCKSIINQTNQKFEWIVVDGASRADTLDILSRYQYRMDTFISEPDDGVYFAMNKGIKRAQGTYLLFMNGGDLFYGDDVVDKVFPYLEKADVLYGDSFRLFENEKDCFIKTYPDKLTKSFLALRQSMGQR